MTADNIPSIVSRYPELLVVSDAIRQYFDGEAITVHCPKCGNLLKVEAIKAIDTVWVKCPKGHVGYHENYAPGTLNRKLPHDNP